MRATSLLLFVLASAPWTWAADSQLLLESVTNRVATFSRIEFTIKGVPDYSDPFDPAVVDLGIDITAPEGEVISVPAFYAQGYERQRPGEGGAPADWVYPVGRGGWRARFAPSAAGRYRATAVLRDGRGEAASLPVAFECVASTAKGFLRVARKDPRFLEYDNGEAFFAIGQNLAFIGEQQYVTLPKAEEVFKRLSANGANYLRVWTCAEDWALAIEARKSAWGRSWGDRGRLVPDPDEPGRRCLLMASNHVVQEVTPSHRVGVRPGTRYVLTGRVRAEAEVTLQLEVHGSSSPPLAVGTPLEWILFRHEFTTGARDWWLGPTRFRRKGPGAAWLADVSLKESTGGAELLWEADMNRPARGFYNPRDCQMLDDLLNAAERHGIHLQLCLLTRDLYMEALANGTSVAYEQAISDAKKFFRHAVGRWGAFTSVAAWEYWNEMNPGLPTDRFYRELGGFLEKSDPYRHLRTTSAWGPSAKDCRHAELDVADVHFYLRPADKQRLANEVEAVLERVRWLREQAPNKPAHLGEFGLADDQWRITENMRRSPDLSDLHNALWASALSGASGTALCWWWERLDQRNGYPSYRPLSRFLADIPWNSGEVRALEMTCSDASFRTVGLRADRRAWFWLFDPAAAWAKVAVEGQQPPVRRDVLVTISSWEKENAAVRAEFMNTRSGETAGRLELPVTNGMVRLQIPPFERDIACRLAVD